MKKTFKSHAVTTIVTGVISAALWEYISPLLTSLYFYISSLIDQSITTFSNDTYKKIATGTNNLSFLIYIVLFAMLISYILFLIQSKLFKKNNEAGLIPITTIKSENRNKLLFKLVTVLVLTFFILVCSYLIGNNIFIDKCQTTSLCNLEIIAPYITDLEYKELKSAFYTIQSKADYDSFSIKIYEIGEKYSLNLIK